jgi:Ca-activated chloride channel family protein
LEAALQAGLEILATSDEQDTSSGQRRDAASIIAFLTDGLPTAGVTDETLIARLVTRANARKESRLHVFGVGYDVNTHLLDRLAADNGGSVTYVQPGENLEAVLTGFYERIAYPVLTDVKVEFEGLEASDLYPQQVPDMFQGSSLLLSGRYRATRPSVTLRVRGQAAGIEREYIYHFDLDRTGEHDFVPRLWATRRVGELLDRVRVEGENPALVDEIRELGLSYGLVTPYTTFVIQAQADGAASAANMALYANQAELNQAWGQVTVQARVQNQLYQQADQASLANGANVVNYGGHNLAQVANQNVDLSLLQERRNIDHPITTEWVDQNIEVDRYVAFGSDEYFALAGDEAARPLLQSGPNVIFAYQGQVIAVQDSEGPTQGQEPGHATLGQTLPQGHSTPKGHSVVSRVYSWLRQVIED